MQKIKVASISTQNYIGETDRSIRDLARWARKASEENVDLMVFPELGINGYVHNSVSWDLAEEIPGPTTDRIVRIAEEADSVICFGMLERDADVAYNTQVLVNGHGILGKQRKIHMPMVEYLYWRSGFEIETFDLGKARVGIMICYD